MVSIARYSRFAPRLSVEPASGLLFLPFPRRTWKIAVYFAAVVAFSFARIVFGMYALLGATIDGLIRRMYYYLTIPRHAKV